ncbi:hypothetical protein ABPG74_001723 [Tetrahymena malaccensis]
MCVNEGDRNSKNVNQTGFSLGEMSAILSKDAPGKFLIWLFPSFFRLKFRRKEIIRLRRDFQLHFSLPTFPQINGQLALNRQNLRSQILTFLQKYILSQYILISIFLWQFQLFSPQTKLISLLINE